MSLDGRLVGTDFDEYEEFYQPIVECMRKELAERGVDAGALNVGSAGQTYADQIGRTASLHLLRSYAACVAVHGSAPDESEPSVIGHELNQMYEGRLSPQPFFHLIIHSEEKGFYIPVDFKMPFSFEAPGLNGTWTCDLGSSQALLRELDELNKFLQMPGDLGELCGSARVEQEIEGDPFHAEKWVWAVLHWLARESVAKSLLFEFC